MPGILTATEEPKTIDSVRYSSWPVYPVVAENSPPMPTDDARIALRPQLALAPAAAPDEQFQNDTLRPIMKMQHDLLLAVFRMFLAKRKVKLEQLPAKQRFAKIKELLTRDNRLRGLLFGIAIGQFTGEEMDYYLANDGNVNRRITNLIVERMTSVFAPA